MPEEINATAIIVETSRVLQSLENMLLRVSRRNRDGLVAQHTFDGKVTVRCPVWRNFAEYTEVTMLYGEGNTLHQALNDFTKQVIKMHQTFPLRPALEQSNDDATKYS